MKFRLEFDIKKIYPPITHEHKLLLIGSCFTENIGEKFERYKFSVLQNPNGILFNPVSVAEALTGYIENKQLTHDQLFYYQESWHSWKHHSRFSSITATQALEKINTSTLKAHLYLQDTSYLLITLGSAWIYTFTEQAIKGAAGEVAANNHKAPANWFSKRLMTAEETTHVLTTVIEKLLMTYSKMQIIFTISPVRHIRDGVIGNNRSKAVLIQAVHQLVNANDRLHYFPAYELVVDDLRDYRYYSEDLVHPNYFATEYVWERFVSAYLNEETKKLMDEINSVNLAFTHKPFNPDSSQHLQFLSSYYHKTRQMQLLHPSLDFKTELKYFSRE